MSFSSEDEQEEKDLKIQIQSIVDNIQDVSCSNQFNASADRDKDIIRGNISSKRRKILFVFLSVIIF